MRRTIAILLSLGFWAIAAWAGFWLLMQRFPPTGEVVFDVPFDGRSAWIDPFLPGERVTSPGPQQDGWVGQRIIQEPVYASARTPGVFDTVDVEVEFRTIRQPLLELGLLRDEEAFQFEYKPLWFEPLQDEAVWHPVSIVRGYARERKFQEAETIAVWHASTTYPALSDPAHAMQTTRVSLRGAHDIYAVPAGGQVQFSFEMQDVNRARGPDTVAFRLFKNGEIIGADVLGIGGAHDSGMGPVIEKEITIPNATPGVYRIQIIADDDIFIRAIHTNAMHWVLGPRLVFADEVGFEPEPRAGIAWSNSQHVVLETFHNEGLQTVTFGSQEVALTRTHDTFRIDRREPDAHPQRIEAPVGDVRIVGDGWFALSPEAFFTPQPRRMTDGSDPLAEGVTTIHTPYLRPLALGDGWFQATTTFQLDPREDRLRFALAAPGILSRTGAVDIRNIRLTYRRPPLSWEEWQRVLKEELRNAWYRLR